MAAAQQRRLTELLEPVVEAMGYELVCVEYQQARPNLLRLYIDAERGIDVDDCEAVSRQVSATLDVEDPISGEYNLEVSSPGLDRPLVKPAHFVRWAGETVTVRLTRNLDGRRKYKGELLGYADGAVQLQVEGSQLSLPLEDIDRARVVPDFSRLMGQSS